MKICMNCKSENTDSSRFCRICGVKFPEEAQMEPSCDIAENSADEELPVLEEAADEEIPAVKEEQTEETFALAEVQESPAEEEASEEPEAAVKEEASEEPETAAEEEASEEPETAVKEEASEAPEAAAEEEASEAPEAAAEEEASEAPEADVKEKVPARKKDVSGFAIASLCLGCMGIFSGFLSVIFVLFSPVIAFLYLIPSILAIVFGIIGIASTGNNKKHRGRVLAIVGLVLGIVFTLFWLGLSLLLARLVITNVELILPFIGEILQDVLG